MFEWMTTEQMDRLRAAAEAARADMSNGCPFCAAGIPLSSSPHMHRRDTNEQGSEPRTAPVVR